MIRQRIGDSRVVVLVAGAQTTLRACTAHAAKYGGAAATSELCLALCLGIFRILCVLGRTITTILCVNSGRRQLSGDMRFCVQVQDSRGQRADG